LKTCHYKHWLVDRRQQLWYAIAGKQYLREWINAVEMADTPERFGIVPLSSVDLQVPLQLEDPSHAEVAGALEALFQAISVQLTAISVQLTLEGCIAAVPRCVPN
jgi:hypothetical protein